MDGPAHISLTLPLPPSANRLHRRGRDGAGNPVMHKSGDYRDWIKRAGQLALIQAAGDAVPYRYAMRVVVPETRKDCDNYIKPAGDLLQKARVVTNDKHLRRLLIEVDPARTADTMLVELWALPDVAPPKRARKLVLTPPKPKPVKPPKVRMATRRTGKAHGTVSARIGGSPFPLPADKLPPGFRP